MPELCRHSSRAPNCVETEAHLSIGKEAQNEHRVTDAFIAWRILRSKMEDLHGKRTFSAVWDNFDLPPENTGFMSISSFYPLPHIFQIFRYSEIIFKITLSLLFILFF